MRRGAGQGILDTAIIRRHKYVTLRLPSFAITHRDGLKIMILNAEQERMSAAEIWSALEGGTAGWSFDDCPWVKVGNLYMSVTFTGDTSWKAIAEANSGKKIIVLTGRHGEQAGAAVGSDNIIVKGRTYDKEHVAQDKEIKSKYFPDNGDIEIKDLWLYNSEHTVDNLQVVMLSHLQKGDVVVCAWCFSLFCLYSFSAEAAPFQSAKHVELTVANNDKKVSDIITEKFKPWVPGAA
jgi:hypothetical protein